LATNRQFKNRQTGAMVQEVCYIDIDVWGPQAESCSQYLQKGRSVLIEGRLKFDSWEDAQGNKRGKHSVVADRVVFLFSAADQTDQSQDEDFAQTAKPSSNLEPELEKELNDQLDAIKRKKAATSAAAPKAKTAPQAGPAKKAFATEEDIQFKDEPPFEDELPF
jgi:single-strand DNA-binding protein